jgi:hypothetical protein
LIKDLPYGCYATFEILEAGGPNPLFFVLKTANSGRCQLVSGDEAIAKS